MKNIALISHTSNLGGAERMLVNLAILLQKTGEYNPIIFIPENGKKMLRDLCEKENIDNLEVDCSEDYIFITKENLRSKFEKTMVYIKRLEKYFLDYDIKFVISNTSTIISSVIASYKLNIPVLTWIHGILSSYSIPAEYDPELRSLLDKFLFFFSDKIFCCSQWTTNYYLNYTEKSKIQTLHNWTPNIEKITKKDKNIFVCLNSFEHHKGVLTLLKAISIVVRKNRNFTLELYGDGNQKVEKEMRMFIKDKNLEKVIKIYQRRENTEEIYNNSFCLVQPSFIEPFGMTIIEAMSHSKVVIASKAGGPEEIIIDGKTGYLVDKNDEEALAEKMLFLLENKEKAYQMGKNGFERFRKYFSEERVLPIFEETIEELLEKKKRNDEMKDYFIDIFEKVGKIDLKYTINEYIPVSSNKKIEEMKIALSKPIKNRRKYKIFSKKNTISKLGFVFGKKNEIINGKIKLTIKYKDKKIRETTIDIQDIEFENWYIFKFKKIKDALNKEYEIEFTLENSRTDLCIYELKEKRTFIYKLIGKLGYSANGLDSVFYDY